MSLILLERNYFLKLENAYSCGDKQSSIQTHQQTTKCKMLIHRVTIQIKTAKFNNNITVSSNTI